MSQHKPEPVASSITEELDLVDLQLRNSQRSDEQRLDAQCNEELKPLSIAQLEGAFDLFNRVSVELDTSYKELEIRVSELTAELAQSRRQRIKELAERDSQVNRLSSLISMLPSGVVLLDKNTVVRDMNPKAIELLGEPMIGLSWSGVIAKVAVPEARAGFEVKMRDGHILSVVSRELGDSGERVVLITEVTSIHHTQERMSRDKRLAALGEMAASLAHQIRTPLSSAVLYMSQLALNELPKEARATISGRVQDRLVHMSSLVDSMLDFVRGAKPLRNVICLNELVEKAGQLVKASALQAGAVLDLPRIDDSVSIEGDIEALAGAVANLILNAIEICQEDAEIRVWAGAINPHQIQIKVSDNGPGVDPEMQDKIFHPFFTTRTQGTGLGLAVVAMTAAAHDGDIWVENKADGGAEFTMTLPMLEVSTCLQREVA